MSTRKQILVGFPSSGKTTFLVALWYSLLQSGTRESHLSLEKLVGDNEYINTLMDKWVKCEELGRTIVPGKIIMELRDEDSNTSIDVCFPDIDGETHNLQFEERKWTRRFQEDVDEADGFLFFVHPAKVIEPMTVIELETIVGNNQAVQSGTPVDAARSEASGVSKQVEPREEWSIKRSSFQVKIVDLLQFIMLHRRSSTRLRVTVVVSAWDLVENNVMTRTQTPLQWLQFQLPLLYQFLVSNSPIMDSHVFGVSAQGGELPKDREKLLGENQPVMRVLVKDDSGRHLDLASPIKWIISNND